MSESTGLEVNGGKLQDFTIDQAAGALALGLGAIGTLLLVIWQSRCLCKCRLGFSDSCYIFSCERAPPPLEGDEEKEKKDKVKPKVKPKKEVSDEEKLIPDLQLDEPEPEPEIIPLV